MGVIAGRQSEMSAALRGVFGLLHGAQGQTGKQRFLLFSLDAVQKLLHLLRITPWEMRTA